MAFVKPLTVRASTHAHIACLYDPVTPVMATVLVVPYDVCADRFVVRENEPSDMVAVIDPFVAVNDATPFASIVAFVAFVDVTPIELLPRLAITEIAGMDLNDETLIAYVRSTVSRFVERTLFSLVAAESSDGE
jgi:hypothetical protein